MALTKAEHMRLYRQRHPDLLRVRGQAYYQKNRVVIRAKQKVARLLNPEVERERHLRRYGLTSEQYEAILIQQGGVCMLCQKSGFKKRLSVDHDHETGKVRGLLCPNCNRSLGLYWDNKEML